MIGPDQRTQSVAPVEATWTAAAGGTKIEENDNVSVIRISAPLDAGACTRLSSPGRGTAQSVIAVGSGGRT